MSLVPIQLMDATLLQVMDTRIINTIKILIPK